MAAFRGFSREPRVRGYGPALVEMIDTLAYADEIRGFRAYVEPGFVFDGSSVPRWLWWALGIRRPHGRRDPLSGEGFGGLGPKALEKWKELLPNGALHDLLARSDARIYVPGKLGEWVSVPVPGKRWAAEVFAESILARGSTGRLTAGAAREAVTVATGYWHKEPVSLRPALGATA